MREWGNKLWLILQAGLGLASRRVNSPRNVIGDSRVALSAPLALPDASTGSRSQSAVATPWRGRAPAVGDRSPQPTIEQPLPTWRYNLAALSEMLAEPIDAAAEAAQLPSMGAPMGQLQRLDPEQVLQQMRGITQVPVLQSVARSFQMASRSRDASLSELGDMVRGDPGLHAKILRMINSSFFRLDGEVTDVEHAMILLGMDRIRYMAHSLGAVGGLNELTHAFDLRHLWSHSFACGLLAEFLVRELRLPDLPHAYSAGLLHDVGKILLSSHYPDAYRGILRLSYHADFDLSEAERFVFGMDHEAVGGLFAASQRLPQGIAAAMSSHGQPSAAPTEERDTVIVLFLANQFSKEFQLGFSGNPARANEAELLDGMDMLSSQPLALCRDDNARAAFIADLRARITRNLPRLLQELDSLLRLTFNRQLAASC